MNPDINVEIPCLMRYMNPNPVTKYSYPQVCHWSLHMLGTISPHLGVYMKMWFQFRCLNYTFRCLSTCFTYKLGVC